MAIILTSIALPTVFYLIFPIKPFYYVWFIWGGFGLIRLIYRLADWYFDAWLITNTGVIDVKWNGFFNRSSTRMEYNAIRGLTYSIQGFWGTIFNFGDVSIEHFLSSEVVVLRKAVSPKKIERAILSAQNTYLESKTVEDHEALKTMLIEMVMREKVKRQQQSSS